jgi:hypothetical protein
VNKYICGLKNRKKEIKTVLNPKYLSYIKNRMLKSTIECIPL